MIVRGPKVIVPPEEPISIEECRSHLEAAAYADSDGESELDALDDTMILGWLSAAREYCEQFTGLSFSRRVLEVALDSFPNEDDDGTTAIELPFGPVLEIQSVGDSSSSSEEAGLSDGTYTLDNYSSPSRLLPNPSWPAMSGNLAIRIRYLAGYGVDTEWPEGIELPWAARAAMLLVLGHLYANREEATDKAMMSLPLGAEALLRPLRVRLGMA